MNRFSLFPIIIAILFSGCANKNKYTDLQNDLISYAKSCSAEIGIAVIIDGKDTVTVNCDREYPMLSVYKFPQALAVANFAENYGILPDDSIDIAAEEIKPDTYSPMREKYGIKSLKLPLHELLGYSLQQSDNNACDIMFRLIGGTDYAQHYLDSIGFNNIRIANTEAEMHENTDLCYNNSTNPIDMARLMELFSTGIGWQSPIMHTIFNHMTTCETGKDRLALPLQTTNATLGHKTGTGDKNSKGEIIGINDAGFVFLPNGHRYSIAVFVKDSQKNMEETSKMIAYISEMTLHAVMNPENK